MLVKSLSFGNYNARTLINNPPYITNLPFYEYMRDNKIDFDSTDLRMFRKVEHQESKKDNIMTCLFVVTALLAGTAIYIGRNNLVAGYRKVAEKVKNAYNRVFHS